MLGAATGNPVGVLVGGFLGGFSSTLITDAFSNEGVSYERATSIGLIGAATAGFGSLFADKFIRIGGYKLIYPGLRVYSGNLRRLFTRRGLPLSGNVRRTATNQLLGNSVASVSSQVGDSLTKGGGLGGPFSGGGGFDPGSDQLLPVPSRGIPYGGFFWPGVVYAGQIAVVNVNSGTINWITPIMSPVATPFPSPVDFPFR